MRIGDVYWKKWITEMDSMLNLSAKEIYAATSVNKVYLLRTFYRHPLTSISHLATAAVLEKALAKEETERDELLLASEKCNDAAQKAEIHVRLSVMCQRQFWSDEDLSEEHKHKVYLEALDHLDLAIDLIADKSSYTRCLALKEKLCFLKDQDEGLPLHGSEIDQEIIGLYHEIRTHSLNLSDEWHNILTREIIYYDGRYDLTVNFFVGLTPVQRVLLIMDISPRRDLNRYLLPAAVATDRVAEVGELYQELSRNLDLAGCGTLWWHKSHVNYLHRAGRDLQMSSSVLQRVLATPLTSMRTAIGNRVLETAVEDAESYMPLTLDILYQRFR